MSVYSRPYSERDGSVFQVYEKFSIEFREASHAYWIHSETRDRVVSVTGALRVLDKPALARWIEDCGAAGGAALAAMGELENVPLSEVGALVRLHKLGADAKREVSADRGTAVHRVLELWAREGAVPNLADFAPEVRGYVQGLCSWLLQARPKASSVERFVGSLEHQYAGRLDMRATLADGREVVVDLKTSPSARVYPEGHIQARAYALADVECGSPEPDGIVIVGVGADGSWTQVECEATAEDWLAILRCYRTMGRLRQSIKVTEKAAA